MSTHQLRPTSAQDPLLEWAGRLRAEVLTEMAPTSIGGIAGLAAAGVISPTVTAAAAVAAMSAVIEGGTMTSSAIAATATSHVALKLAAGGLAAALTLGGAAAVTGNLPDGAQRFAADAAAHIGLDLPRPDVTIGGSMSLGDMVKVGEAGRVRVMVDGSGLRLDGIEANAGFSTRVVSATADTLVVEFESAAETTTVFLANIEGEVVSSVTTTLDGSAGAAVEIDGDGGTRSEAEGGVEITIGG